MAFDDQDSNNRYGAKKNDSRGPHPDADRNFHYSLNALKDVTLIEPEGMERLIYKYSNCDSRTGVVTEPIYIGFYWHNSDVWRSNNTRFGKAISFHQDSAAFINEFDKFVGSCVSKGLISRPNNGSMNSYK